MHGRAHLNVDTVGLVREKGGESLFQYVNDRPYGASSFLSVAIVKAFGTAPSGRSKDRPELKELPGPKRELHVYPRFCRQMSQRILFAVALSLWWALPAAAHHGKDFLIIESPELAQRRSVHFVSSESFTASTFTTEPSILIGVSGTSAVEVHVHAERLPGQSLRYEAIAPAIHLRFGGRSRWSFAGSAEWEIARHAENALNCRFIAARSLAKGSLTINVANHGGYGIGFRPDMEARTSWGIEAGREERGEAHEILFGVYTEPVERFTVKAGVGLGVGQGSRNVVLRTGFVWTIKGVSKK